TVTASLALLSGQTTGAAFAQDTSPSPAPTPAPVANPSQSPVPAPAQQWDSNGRPINTTPNKQGAKKGKKTPQNGGGDADTQHVSQRQKGTAEKLLGPLFRDI